MSSRLIGDEPEHRMERTLHELTDAVNSMTETLADERDELVLLRAAIGAVAFTKVRDEDLVALVRNYLTALDALTHASNCADEQLRQALYELRDRLRAAVYP